MCRVRHLLWWDAGCPIWAVRETGWVMTDWLCWAVLTRSKFLVDNEASVVTSEIFKSADAQSFGGAHRGKICICVFIGVSGRKCVGIYIVLCNSKKRTYLSFGKWEVSHFSTIRFVRGPKSTVAIVLPYVFGLVLSCCGLKWKWGGTGSQLSTQIALFAGRWKVSIFKRWNVLSL